jgi:hypothetical protein
MCIIYLFYCKNEWNERHQVSNEIFTESFNRKG